MNFIWLTSTISVDFLLSCCDSSQTNSLTQDIQSVQLCILISSTSETRLRDRPLLLRFQFSGSVYLRDTKEKVSIRKGFIVNQISRDNLIFFLTYQELYLDFPGPYITYGTPRSYSPRRKEGVHPRNEERMTRTFYFLPIKTGFLST